MQNNLRNRSVALASTFALALTGIVATAPAASANAALVLGPKDGTNLGAFITDDFDMSAAIPTTLSPAEKAIRVTNPKEEVVEFTIDEANLTVSMVTLRAEDALGNTVNIDSGDLGGAATSGDVSGRGSQITLNATDTFTFDFSDSDVTQLTILDFEDSSGNPSTDRVFDFGVQVKADKTTAFDHGDGNQGDVTVQTWVEISAVQNFDTVDTSTASAAATVKWYDPKGVAVIPSIKRFVEDDSGTVDFNYNSVTDDSTRQGLGGKISFVRPDLNLDQVEGTEWGLDVFTSSSRLNQTSLNSDRKRLAGATDAAGNLSDDVAGSIYFHQDDDALVAGETYYVEVFHKDSTDKKFRSVAFSPSAGPSEERLLYVSVSDTDNTTADSAAPGKKLENGNTSDSGSVDRLFDVRPGTESLTYTAKLFELDSTTPVKSASQQIAAVVTANGYAPTGTTYTVSGSSDTINSDDQSIVVSGLTNSDGEYSVTVTASNPVASTGYDIEFYSLSTDGEWSNGLVDGTRANASSGDVDRAVTVKYADATVSSPTVVQDTLAGETVTASVKVKDNYGVETSLKGSDALYVTFESSDGTSLDETVAVVDGAASVTFDNYVASNESDLITVSLHTGATFSSANLVGSAQVISLYNASAIAGVNVPEELAGVITYDDFITGTASSTNVAPNDGAMSITGTLVDSNGAGVPGALVTVDAAGMQLRKSGAGDYALDTISFAANAAGQFTVQLWSHTVDTTGVDVTISSGGQSATTTVKTYLPSSGVDGNNLVFSMDTPANIDVNKTYAMTATLTDKWGNPIKTSTDGTPNGVDFQGTGSVEINSSADAVPKNFGKDGSVTVFVRSIKDIEGPGAITATLGNAAYTYYDTTNGETKTAAIDRSEITTDAAATAHDETSFSNELTVDVNVGEAAATSADQKVNAGSFKGYVALYAKGYEGQRMSAIVAGKWLQVDSLASDFERVVRFTGAGYDIKVRIYIDGEQVGPEFDITTK